MAARTCRNLIAVLLAAFLFAQFNPAARAQEGVHVELALVLAVDCSHSVNSAEYRLQMEGLAQALTSSEVIAALTRNPIAVTVVQWSGADDQKIAVPWTILDDAQSTFRLAAKIRAVPRLSVGKTSIAAAIDFSLAQLAALSVNAPRQVIDISADGINNDGASPAGARKRALTAGVTVNGLTILNDVSNLDDYFERFIIAGPGSFVMPANDYDDYRIAIRKKLLREITGLQLY